MISDLEIILEEVKKAQPIVRRKRHRVAALLGGPDCTVMLQKCNDDLDWAMEEFKVSLVGLRVCRRVPRNLRIRRCRPISRRLSMLYKWPKTSKPFSPIHSCDRSLEQNMLALTRNGLTAYLDA